MGRLENIIARNRHPKRFGERLSVGLGLALFLLVIIFLVVFTDLGLPPELRDAPPATERPAHESPPTPERRVDDVRLYTAP